MGDNIMRSFYLGITWIAITILVISITTSLLTIASTILNIGGFLLAAAWIGISYKTKCFTAIKFIKNEESN
jgi:hypothetical protein